MGGWTDTVDQIWVEFGLCGGQMMSDRVGGGWVAAFPGSVFWENKSLSIPMSYRDITQLCEQVST